MTQALVIGAGPAGLMAAEMIADAGFSVLVAEAKPSVGRKLLMAGKSGLNLTKDEPFERFIGNFGESAEWLEPSLAGFDPIAVQEWARNLGQTVFTGSTGRVFPVSMKASPLLRSWIKRLSEKGVVFKTRWRWEGWQNAEFTFGTPEGVRALQPKATVLALGGASWARLGADGRWVSKLNSRGIGVSPFLPSNMGIVVPWSDHMTSQFGRPLKNIAIGVGGSWKMGECVISKTGLEGSLIYQFSGAFRAGKPLVIDLLPNFTAHQIAEIIQRHQSSVSISNLLRKGFNFDAAKIALFMEVARATPRQELGGMLKFLPIRYSGISPLDGAISVAGGVPQSEFTPDFMLKSAAGVFCAGEMLDWEAPTGGYLLTACLATGRTAGLAAASYVRSAGF
jgi:uncharacterized flavoprotein (TIGR03862 family)